MTARIWFIAARQEQDEPVAIVVSLKDKLVGQ